MDSHRLIFAAVSPPFEKTALKEFNDKTLKRYNASLDKGGFLFEAPLEEVSYIQRYLKSPTRLLLRLKEQRIRDFPKFFKMVQSIPWNDYLLNGEYELNISAAKSRLNNEKRLEETFIKAISSYFKANNPAKSKKDYCHQIYIRLNSDQCSISIDLSGEPLYKRGRDKKIDKAPIRENLAYMILYNAKNAYSEDTLFIDPMCGSATFAEEVIYWNKENKRDFAINNFFKINEKAVDLCLEPLLYKNIMLNDLSLEAISTAKKNLKEQTIEFFHLDAKEFLNQYASEQSFLVCNLPYGKRIKKGDRTTKDWLDILENTKAKKLVCISDQKGTKTFWKETSIYNGGIKVWLLESK